MQNQELLAKLTQARQAQAMALRRFAQAQERLAQLELRQQALHLRTSTPSPDQIQRARPQLPARNQHQASLAESEKLELQEDFTPPPQTERDQTERIATQPTEAPQ